MEIKDDHWSGEFFDAMVQLIGILDVHGKLVRINRAGLDLMGLTQADVVGMAVQDLPWAGLSRQGRRLLKQAVHQAGRGQFVRAELEMQPPGQPEMIIDFSFNPVLDDGEKPGFMIVEGRDITTLKRTVAALNQSEARFKTIFEGAGVGIVIKGVDGKMLDCNPAFQNLVGYSADELRQLDYINITHPVDKVISNKLFKELVRGKRKSYTIEKRYIHKTGAEVWGRITTSLVQGSDRQALFVIGIVENITAHKRIQAELLELQQRLTQGREDERLRLAQDLHDGPLQEIIGISFQVKALKNSGAEGLDREQLQSIQDALQDLARSVRLICGELRPPNLVPFGLERSILSHANGFRAAHPELEVVLSLDQDGQKLSKHVRVVLFRIYQEAMNNLQRHAEASKVSIRFSMRKRRAVLEVQDNGKGFDLPENWINLARQGHLGLVGARERARDVGGELELMTAPGQGTTIRAVIPLAEQNLPHGVPGEDNAP